MTKKRRKNKRLSKHLRSLGFTNRLAVYILCFLLIGICGGFVLAWRSIGLNYMGALACWTVAFTPLGTAISIALGKIVDKSRAENTKGGIKYETAIIEQLQGDMYGNEVNEDGSNESPMI